MQYLPLYTHFTTNPAQLTQVPLNGPLKSTSLIMSQQQSMLSYSHINKTIDSSGMVGSILQVPLTTKQVKSQTIQNFIRYLEEFYEDFEVKPNVLQPFYPK
jgi:hypothetical protein